MTSDKNDVQTKSPPSGTSSPPQDTCRKAPEWAEHQRLDDDDMPCDDGREGNIERKRDDMQEEK